MAEVLLDGLFLNIRVQAVQQEDQLILRRS
jgi:hypothetical protein